MNYPNLDLLLKDKISGFLLWQGYFKGLDLLLSGAPPISH